jgi:cytochrome c-type biogenesis protein CcmH
VLLFAVRGAGVGGPWDRRPWLGPSWSGFSEISSRGLERKLILPSFRAGLAKTTTTSYVSSRRSREAGSAQSRWKARLVLRYTGVDRRRTPAPPVFPGKLLMKVLFLLAVFALLPFQAPTASAEDTAALEQEARVLETMIVAPCCWNQQVAVHYSPAADKVRSEIRAMLASGKTRQQILDDYVARYGDRILAEPPARGFNRGLYVLPWVFLGFTSGLVVVVIRKLRSNANPSEHATDSATDRRDDDYDERLEEELRNMD